MADAAALIVLNGLFVCTGLAVMYAIGVPFRGAWLPSSLGLTPVTGVLACSLVSAELVVLGIPVGVPAVAATAGIAVAIAFCARGRLRARLGSLAPQRQTRLGLVTELGLLALLTWVSIGIMRLVTVMPLSSWDGWAIWGARANALFVSGSAWNPSFLEEPYALQHQGYPVLYPTLEAISLDAIGRFDVTLIDVEPALLLISCGLAIWSLLRLAIPPALAALTAVVLTSTGKLVENVSWNYADGALAMVIALGLISVALWLIHDAATMLLLGGLFLASSAMIKNEGLMFSAAAVVAAALAAHVARRPLRPVLLLGAAVIIISLPWQLFVRINDLETSGDLRFSSLFSPSYIAGHADRIETASRTLLSDLADVWALPAVAAVAGVFLALMARRYMLFIFAVVWFGLGFSGLVATYVASTVDFQWHLQTSADRVVGTLAIGLAALSPIMAWTAWLTIRPGLVPAPRPKSREGATGGTGEQEISLVVEQCSSR